MTDERKALIDKMLRTDVSDQFDIDRPLESKAAKRERETCNTPVSKAKLPWPGYHITYPPMSDEHFRELVKSVNDSDQERR